MLNLTGMRAFIVIWTGQTLSRIGSFLTGFALSIWAFDQTQQATTFTLWAFLGWGTSIFASPFAGAFVDRWNRKLTLILSDALAMASTLVVLILYMTGNLQIWHLYVQAVVLGIGDAFQWPAFSAATSTMLKQEDYARAYGLQGMVENATGIFAPPLAAVLLTFMRLEHIMLIDFITFMFAIGGILLVTIPAAQVSAEGKASRESRLIDQLTFGLRYIVSRPSLLGLQLIILAYVTLSSLGSNDLVTPMILSRTGGNEVMLGITQMAFAIGGVVSGALLGAKGGFKDRPSGLFLGIVGQCTGYALMGMGRGTIVWALGAFCSSFSVSIALAANQAYWQSKVPPDIQGKVFSMRRMIAQIAGPLALLAAGPLADRVFEPMMASGTSPLTFLVGSGRGAGMGLQMVIFGTLGALAGLAGFLFRATREAESLLPDHTQPEPESTTKSAPDPVAVPAG